MPGTEPVPAELLSVVVPVFNEAGNIEPLLSRLLTILTKLARPFEIIFVNDGSTDKTAEKIALAAAGHPQIRCIELSRNFGHQAALVAGLAHARGAAVITMDGDLQHPPELIPVLVERWCSGFEVVQAVRRHPADESRLKRLGSHLFYRLLSSLSRYRVTAGASDFRLMSREAVDAFLSCPERCRFNRGLVQWIGFRYCEVPYDAAARHSGRSKYSYRAMLRLAGDAIFSFSSLPLRLAGLIGAATSVIAGLYLIFVLWAYFFTDLTIPGWSSILAAVLVLGGVNLIVLWILGEYVGRLYEEVKQRPIYIVRSPQQKAQAIEPAERPAQERHDAPPGTPVAVQNDGGHTVRPSQDQRRPACDCGQEVERG
jgi:glycosyltransferase involved in cell wall biosynthesis